LKVQLGGALGSTLIPVLDFIIKALQTVSQFLQDYPQIAAALAWVGAIGGVILVVGGTIMLIAGLAGAISALWPMIVAVAAVLAKIALWVAAIGGLVALVVIFWEQLKPLFIAIGGWLWEHLLKPVWGFLVGVGKFWAMVGVFLWDYLIRPLAMVLLPVVSFILFVMTSIITGVLMVLRILWGVVETILAFLTALVTWDWSGFEEKLGEIWASVTEDIQSLGTFFVDTIVAAIMEIPGKLLFGGGAWGGGTDPEHVARGEAHRQQYGEQVIPYMSFAAGTTQIPHDGPIYAHEGEEITQRGRSNSNKPSIGQVTFNVHGVQDPEGFMNRAYAQLQRLMANDMQMTVRP